ncbi:hypothetical protein CRENBAI_008125 [Crenichthys baileyi]|uniref:Uncharacterized protein n=1 Tax=Crenichthys baileyi TaxID=28760 RepID=A0AAV9R8Q4_9TELE
MSGETKARRRTFPPHGHSRKSLKAVILSDTRRYGGDLSHRHPKALESTVTPGEPPPGTTTTPSEKTRGESQENHPEATVQKPQGAAAMSQQAPPAAVYAQADPAMDPETLDPGTYHSPSRGRTEPRSPGPVKQPPGMSQHITKHPAPDTKNHKYTGGQRHQPLAGSMAGRE